MKQKVSREDLLLQSQCSRQINAARQAAAMGNGFSGEDVPNYILGLSVQISILDDKINLILEKFEGESK